MCEVIVDEVEGEGVKEEEGEEGAGWWTMDINFGSRLNSMFNVPVGLGHFFSNFQLRGGWDRGDRGESEMSDRGRGGYR